MKYEGKICKGSMKLGTGCGKCEKCIDEIAEAAGPKEEYIPPIVEEDSLHGFAQLIYDTTAESIKLGTSPRRQVLRIRKFVQALLEAEKQNMG